MGRGNADHNLLYVFPAHILLDLNIENDPWQAINPDVKNSKSGNLCALSGAGRKGKVFGPEESSS